MSEPVASPPRRAIVARPFEGLEDWYRLEWAEHDGRDWEESGYDEEVGYHFTRLCSSARLEPYTCVEGPAREMRAIAYAVLKGFPDDFKRCAVRPEGKHFAFYSPRNSNGVTALVHGEDARAWAAAFLAEPSVQGDKQGGSHAQE